MLGPLGVPELLFILVLALLIFGPKRLPEIGRTVGRAMGELRRASSDLKRSFDSEIDALELEEKKGPTRPAATALERPAERTVERPAERAVERQEPSG